MTRPHTPQDPADPLLTTREAALLLGVTLRTVQLWADAGKLHAGRTPGGHRRIRTSAVQALAAEQGLGDPVNPLQARLDAALADGRRLHEAYLGAERELEAARAEIERLQIISRRATSEQIEINAIRCCTTSVDHPATFTLGWRAAEAFHGIGAEGSNEPPACRNCGGVGSDCPGKMGCSSKQLVVPAQITGVAP